ncbi:MULTISPECIES: MATE family efflux transporter [unclassified Pseudodesulfovibrio]|uniref:MATE family efflux transporter n=1 Tax=unclassified Pseudodesulfovibrio TaxID=2661612 RepID=UPI000FEC043D|nr:MULTISPECIES: MATE family efflux transporter [unclassified Pseudodesulfovibrio]MCJ2166312.1 MATE family efflux transporter [Pseudodesulfovibrio sp. S3-i]RWU02244.1 MATE family efflux transporter [Pseudodesulfovibrio sp. S3]
MTQSPTDTTDLTTRSIPKVIRQVAVPASVGFFFNTMFNVVDTWWAGRIDTHAVAALALSLPVYFIITALASGIGTGSTALMGSALGARDRDQAALIAVQMLSFGIFVSAFLAWFGLIFSPDIFGWLGAEGSYLTTCLEYMSPIFSCNFFTVSLFLFNAVLQSQGDTRSMRNVLILMATLNVAFDPWFIHGGFGLPAMGLAGVAWATVLLQGVGAVYLLVKARRTGLLKTNSGRNLIPRPKIYAEIARQGFPASLNSMTIALGFFVIFRFVSGFGPEAAAAYGIATRIDQIILLPTIGLSVAALTITAQNYGANRIDRIRENMKKNLLYGAMLILPLSVPIFLFAEPLMRIFTDDPAVTAIGAEYLRIDAFTLYGYVAIFVPTSILQGMKRPLFAIWLGLSRQVAAPYILFTLFTRTLGYPITALWFSILGIVWISAGIAFWFARRTVNRVQDSIQRSESVTKPTQQ